MSRVMNERSGTHRSVNLRGLSAWGHDSKSLRVRNLVKSVPVEGSGGPEKCVGGIIVLGQNFVPTGFTESYWDLNWKNTISVLDQPRTGILLLRSNEVFGLTLTIPDSLC